MLQDWPGVPIRLQVDSEIGRLRQVLLHCPGPELELIAPSNAAAFLFEDLLSVEEAAAEHAVFRALLQVLGVETLDLAGLLASCLPSAAGAPLDWRTPAAERWDIETLIATTVRLQRQIVGEQGATGWPDRSFDRLQRALRECWQARGAAGLAQVLIMGLTGDEAAGPGAPGSPFLLPPLPNMLFMRDPAAVVGGGVVVAAAATPARRREALLLSWIVRGLRRSAGAPPLWLDALALSTDQAPTARLTLECGDLLVIHERIVLLGISERTNATALQELARRLILAPDDRCPVSIVYGIRLPNQRAMMHLDTVLTMISEREWLLYPPAFAGGLQPASAVRLSSDDLAGLRTEECQDLLAALQRDLRHSTGLEDLLLTTLPCGGDDPLRQRREQWTDGANMLAVGPAVVVGYDRNEATFAVLAAHGYRCLSAGEVLADPVLAADIRMILDRPCGAGPSAPRRRYAIAIPSTELSRGRGGPRCMTMPLLREPLCWQHGAIPAHSERSGFISVTPALAAACSSRGSTAIRYC